MTRWLALDRLRALAVVLMVQGHTFSALLDEHELTGAWLRVHRLLHGLTAPTFLLGAGLAFGVTTYASYDRHHRGGKALGDRLRRYMWLVIIGYGLQLPGASLLGALRLQGDQLTPLFRVGPLQLIALTLGLCQLAALALPTARHHALASGLGAIVVLLVSPPIWTSSLSTDLGAFLGAFIDGRSGSLFPVFPWAGFALLGVAGWGLLRHHPDGPGRWPLMITGAALSLGTYAAFRLGLIASDNPHFWHASTAYVLFRLGAVLLLLGLLHLPGDREPSPTQGSGLCAILSRRSLIAYVTHLLVLYGTPLSPNLVHRIGRTLSLPQATVIFATIMALTVAVAYAWDWLERDWARGFRRVQLGLTVLGFVMVCR